DGPATTGRADLRVGTYGSAFVSPSQPDRSQPRGRPELAGKPCFPAEVPAKPPELPARNSPSFLHQIDRAVEVRGIHHRATHSLRASKSGETLPNFRQKSKAVEVRGIHHRATHSLRASKSGETLPNFRQKSKALKARLNHMRDLQEVQLARTRSSRSAQESTTWPLLAPAPPTKLGVNIFACLTGENFWVWTNYREDSAEYSAEV
ncbi:N-terminal nucleophile aminohydrolases superfamily protein, partial [Prunus dulcis]